MNENPTESVPLLPGRYLRDTDGILHPMDDEGNCTDGYTVPAPKLPDPAPVAKKSIAPKPGDE